jgi:hypothetical protein
MQPLTTRKRHQAAVPDASQGFTAERLAEGAPSLTFFDEPPTGFDSGRSFRQAP